MNGPIYYLAVDRRQHQDPFTGISMNNARRVKGYDIMGGPVISLMISSKAVWCFRFQNTFVVNGNCPFVFFVIFNRAWYVFSALVPVNNS